MSAKSNVRIYADGRALAAGAADELAEALQQAAALGPVHFFLSGGSTPAATYDQLVERHAAIDWARVHFYFGDERCVPPEDERSNFAMARAHLLAPLGIADGNVHRIRGEDGPAAAAESYERELHVALGGDAPSVVLLGLGADGHTASLFPGGVELDAETWVTPSAGPQGGAAGGPARVSVSLPFLRRARAVYFLVQGRSKAEAVRRVAHERDDTLPAARVRTESGTVEWLLDRDAAANLPA